MLTTADNLSVGFNSCASRAGSETGPQNQRPFRVSERMRSGEKTETEGRIVIDGSGWPKARSQPGEWGCHQSVQAGVRGGSGGEADSPGGDARAEQAFDVLEYLLSGL